MNEELLDVRFRQAQYRVECRILNNWSNAQHHLKKQCIELIKNLLSSEEKEILGRSNV